MRTMSERDWREVNERVKLRQREDALRVRLAELDCVMDVEGARFPKRRTYEIRISANQNECGERMSLDEVEAWLEADKYICDECNTLRTGEPAERMTMDEKIRTTFTERKEIEVRETMDKFGLSFGDGDELYQCCPECVEEDKAFRAEFMGETG